MKMKQRELILKSFNPKNYSSDKGIKKLNLLRVEFSIFI